MEQKQITLEDIYHRLILLEKALQAKGIISKGAEKAEEFDDEGEFTDEFKAELERRRKTPDNEYISHEEVKKRLFSKRK
jgi:hypothetical protein